MTTMRVDADAMSQAGHGLRRVGHDCAAEAAGVVAALSMLAAASRDPQVLTAALSAGRRWGASLARCGAAVGALGAAVEGAGGAYASCEASAASGFRALGALDGWLQ